MAESIPSCRALLLLLLSCQLFSISQSWAERVAIVPASVATSMDNL